MTSIRFPQAGGEDRRIRELEAIVSKLLIRIEQLEQQRPPRWVSVGEEGGGGGGVKIYYGKTVGNILKNGTGTIEIYDPSGPTGDYIHAVYNKIANIDGGKQCYVAVPELWGDNHLINGEC